MIFVAVVVLATWRLYKRGTTRGWWIAFIVSVLLLGAWVL